MAIYLLASCDKYLDVEPKGIVIPQKFEEFYGILNAEIHTNSYPDHLAYASDDVHTSFSLSARDPNANAYFWKSIIDEDNDASPAIWGTLYRQIYNTNIIINNVMDAVGGSEAEKKQLLGEALAERANAYFYLVTAFTKAYDPATAANLPGIPWVTYTDVTNKTPERSTLEATMQQIIKDLEDAETYLTSNRLNKARINRAVAQAILSRVYLYMGNYPEAEKYAGRALEEPHELINYNDYVFPLQEEDPSILWLRTSEDYSLNYNFYYSNDLLSLYDYWDDLRVMTHAMDYYGDGWHMRFEYDYGWGMYGIRFTELRLTQAEALAHADDLARALAIINEIRELRIADYAYTPLFSTDKEEVIQYVLQERRKELAFGSNRWMDMKRLAKQNRGTSATRQSTDLVDLISIDPNTYTYTFEIPARVLMFNPDMPKNF